MKERAKKIATVVIKKWLKKGNMARCMRDILPSSRLSLIEREEVAKIVHNVVRWKRWYDYLLDFYGIEKIAKNYVGIALGEIMVDEKEAEKALENNYVAIRYSFSDFLASFLKDKEEIMHHLNREARTTLCVNFNKGGREEVIEMLKEEGMDGEASEHIETAVYTQSRARYSQVVKKGYAHVQDESSQLISKITIMHGREILDYCAGNGGKTIAMASFTNNKAIIRVHDINEERMNTLMKRIKLYEARAEIFKGKGEFDVVLVDAPCTGVGAARRNPEAKYVEGTDNYPAIQEEIIKEAWKYVRNDGFLIYSICSFLPEETLAIEKVEGEKIKLNMEGLREYGNGYITWLEEGDILFVSIIKKST